ncbi:MAG TPA: protoheme IX farnesyltransferase [Rhizobiales bacterium]|nr:protoheme IX farnesyltransferase [bacterium BMS3Bbin10]HDO51781.1 protoheme IX farnesyltransferase [Hyphomicrobiales bacterium]
MDATFSAYANVFKLRIGVAIMACALAGLAVTQGETLAAWKVAVLAVCVLAASAAAGAFNQYAERALDARMPRTAGRPFANGTFRADWRWLAVIAGILLASVGAAGLALNGYVALYVFLGAFFYGVVYTIWLKQRTAWNIVIGGLAGSFAVLAGASAADPAIGPAGLLLALVLFLWTPPHFWSLAMALRDQYEAANVPMLPVVIGDAATAKIILVHTIALVAISIAAAFYGLGLIYLSAAVLGGLFFIWRSLQLAARPGPRRAMANFVASLAQLGLLLTAAMAEGWLAG